MQPALHERGRKLYRHKSPRSRGSTCDYCNTSKFGLAAYNNRVNTFCGPYCEAWYFHCQQVRPPDQFELPLHKPPDELIALLRYP